jgi:hypothetical protein
MHVYLRDDAGVLFPVMIDVKANEIPELVKKAEDLDRGMSKRFRCERTAISSASAGSEAP